MPPLSRLSAFLALAISFSARASIGLVMPVWDAELGWSRSFVSGIVAATLIVMALNRHLPPRYVAGPSSTGIAALYQPRPVA